jgi:hypothetical protein
MSRQGRDTVLLARRLARPGHGVAVPQAVASALRARVMVVRQRNRQATILTRAILGKAGRPALLLKGIDIASRVYGDLGTRSMGDIDLLVKPEDMTAFDAVLQGMGYRPELPFAPVLLDNPHLHHLEYRADNGQLPIEMHWRLSRDAIALDLAEIWHRAEPAWEMGVGAFVMAPTDLLIYLCLHIKHHDFEVSPAHLWDLGEVLEWLPAEIDGAAIRRRAAEWGLERAVEIAMHQAARELGIDTSRLGYDPLPAEVAGLIPAALHRFGIDEDEDVETGRHTAMLLAGTGGWRARWSVLRTALLPQRAEMALRQGGGRRAGWLAQAYLAHWRDIWQRKKHVLIRWATNGGTVRARIGRMNALKTWVERPSSVLLIQLHHPHFEIVLALHDALKPFRSVSLWSNSLHFFERTEALREVGLPLHREGARYDAVVLVSGDRRPRRADFPDEIWRLIKKGPVLRVLHRFRHGRFQKPGEIALTAWTSRPFVPATTGLDHLKPAEPASPGPRRLLVQGNIGIRRNYALLSRIAGLGTNVEVRVRGLVGKQPLDVGEDIDLETDLPELAFHRDCAAADFILPLIDPERYPQYFSIQATSSVQIGLSYLLPFIAHRRLFELYPIVGYAYETDDELMACIERAGAVTAADYAELVSEAKAARQGLQQRNAETLRQALRSMAR